MMPTHQRRYEFRCPVHGFVTLTDWERCIISHPAYQRLKKIRQLAWTDQVYPGNRIVPLSKLSSAIAGLKPIRKRMAFCAPEEKEMAMELVAKREGKQR